MLQYDVNRARDAVQFLVDSPYFHHHVTKLRNAVKRPRTLPFKDEAEPLNELLVVGRQSTDALEKLIELAAFKRDSRNDYQRQYMAAKRNRDRLVIKLECLLQGKTIGLDERRQLLLKQYEVWRKEKEQFLAAHKADTLDWASKNEMVRAFWESKDAELTALIAEAEGVLNRKLPRPHKKRTVVVTPPKKTLLRDAFERAQRAKK